MSNVAKQKRSKRHLSTLYQSVLYHLKTIWLFTASDHLTFVLPEVTFGLFGAMSGSAMTTNPSPTWQTLLTSLPPVFAWTWLNTFVFTLSNQGSHSAAKEDALNKPWRPLPSGRITVEQTRHLLLIAIPTTLAICIFSLGAWEETAILFCLTWMYNDLGGANGIFVVRDLIIAVAYACYGHGALRVATGFPHHAPSNLAFPWVCVTSAVIFTTMSIQDLKDLEGDLARGRHTAVIALGDGLVRNVLAAGILVWSYVCPAFWESHWVVYVGCMLFGLLIAGRLLLVRTREADRVSWQLWALWLINLYFLPVLSVK